MFRRLNVLMLIPDLGFGGAERSFLQLKKILEQHHSVSVVSFSTPYQAEMANAFLGQEFLVLHAQDGSPPSLLGRILRWRDRLARVKDLKRSKGIDVAISFLEGADLVNVLTRTRDRTIVSVRGSKVFDPNIRGAGRILRRCLLWPLTYPRADAVVSISPGIAAEVRRLGFLGRNALARTIGVAVPVSDLAEVSRHPVEPGLMELSGSPIIVSWGRMSHEKGYQDLIRVFAGVKRRIPAAKLLLVGDGPLLGRLRQDCAGFELRCASATDFSRDTDVILTGYRPDPIRYGKLGTVFVHSSFSEGFSNALVEALIAGIPIFANDAPWGARSVLSDAPPDIDTPFPTEALTMTQYGVLMPRIDLPAYQRAWEDGLVDVLANPEKYAHYARAGLSRARCFDASIAADAWLDLVQELSQSARDHRQT